MRQLLIIQILFTSILSFAQNGKMGVFIPKDDGSPFDWPTNHMWVDKPNRIASTHGTYNAFIKIWTDNGRVDSGYSYFNDYYIRPNKVGVVNVFSIQQLWTGKNYDTVYTKNTFQVIMPPKVQIRITKDNFKKDSTITFCLIDSLTCKPINKRYEVGRMYEPKIYDEHDNYIGELILCFGTKINFADENYRRLKVKSGYKIKIRILVRDMKTDLLFPANEFLYTIL